MKEKVIKSHAKSNKSYLPSKNCPVCKRPFTWRKKWKKNWELVIYCSKKCKQIGRGKYNFSQSTF